MITESSEGERASLVILIPGVRGGAAHRETNVKSSFRQSFERPLVRVSRYTYFAVCKPTGQECEGTKAGHENGEHKRRSKFLAQHSLFIR
jgi:hypothetical protein